MPASRKTEFSSSSAVTTFTHYRNTRPTAPNAIIGTLLAQIEGSEELGPKWDLMLGKLRSGFQDIIARTSWATSFDTDTIVHHETADHPPILDLEKLDCYKALNPMEEEICSIAKNLTERDKNALIKSGDKLFYSALFVYGVQTVKIVQNQLASSINVLRDSLAHTRKWQSMPDLIMIGSIDEANKKLTHAIGTLERLRSYIESFKDSRLIKLLSMPQVHMQLVPRPVNQELAKSIDLYIEHVTDCAQLAARKLKCRENSLKLVQMTMRTTTCATSKLLSEDKRASIAWIALEFLLNPIIRAKIFFQMAAKLYESPGHTSTIELTPALRNKAHQRKLTVLIYVLITPFVILNALLAVTLRIIPTIATLITMQITSSSLHAQTRICRNLLNKQTEMLTEICKILRNPRSTRPHNKIGKTATAANNIVEAFQKKVTLEPLPIKHFFGSIVFPQLIIFGITTGILSAVIGSIIICPLVSLISTAITIAVGYYIWENTNRNANTTLKCEMLAIASKHCAKILGTKENRASESLWPSQAAANITMELLSCAIRHRLKLTLGFASLYKGAEIEPLYLFSPFYLVEMLCSVPSTTTTDIVLELISDLGQREAADIT